MQKQIKKSAVDLTELAVGIVILGIVVAIGATIMHQVGVASAKCATGYSFDTATSSCANASGATGFTNYGNATYVAFAAESGIGTYGNWFNILVIVGIAAVILGLIFMAFGNHGSSSGIGGSY